MDCDLSQRLLAWYDCHGRDLPWREQAGQMPDPYRVWLSEIMLQQTTVAVVAGYFADFVRRWPNVAALARADLDDVLKRWAGLGYYARARNLHACARRVVNHHGGRFPKTVAQLKTLPGIGDYTAGAMAAIAFGQREAAVDGNVERVMARVFAIETPLPAAKAELRRRARALVPVHRPGDFAQGLMDLGATVCKPRAPLCALCPWLENCKGRAAGIAERLPVKLAKPERPVRYGTAFVLERADGAVLLRRRPLKGLLGGMLEVPSTPWRKTRPANPEAPVLAGFDWCTVMEPVEHTFTHFHLVLEIRHATAPAGFSAFAGGRWVARADLADEALPSVMKKIITAALGVGLFKPPPRPTATQR